MKRLNIYGAFIALGGPGTKEDVTIQLAKQQNIRFNDLPQLQKEVDRALEESLRLGFVDRQGPVYKLNMSAAAANGKGGPNVTGNTQPGNTTKIATIKPPKEGFAPSGPKPDGKPQGEGDGVRSNRSQSSSCSACSVDFVEGQDQGFSLSSRLRKENSVCAICGLNSDKRNPADPTNAICTF